MAKPRNNNSESGLVLVVVLWVVAVLALLVSAFNSSVRSAGAVLSSEFHDASGTAILEAGLELAAARLVAHDLERGTTEIRQEAANVYRGQLDGHEFSIHIQDANGLIDVNTADESVLTALLDHVTGSRDEAVILRDRIIDWRDKDIRLRPGSAEHDEYTRAGLLNGPGDTKFTDITQLNQVLGFNQELYRRLSPFLTIYSNDGRVNPDVAPDAVLAILAKMPRMDVHEAERNLEQKKKNDSRQATISRETAPGSSSRWLTHDRGKVKIVTISLGGDHGGKGKNLTVAVMPSADQYAPYRILSWRLGYELPGPSRVAQ